MAPIDFFLKACKELTRTVFVFAFLALMVYSVVRYKSHSMETFCENVSITATPATVLAQARALGFPAFDAVEVRGVVTIHNQDSPFFRFSCEVAFKDGKVVRREVLAAD